MTLWCIARSPLILGANLPENDESTLSLLTNDEVIAVDQRSENNRQVFSKNNQVAWMADIPDSKDKYLAIFNAAPAPATAGHRERRPTSVPGMPPAAMDPPPRTIPTVALNPAATQTATISVSLADLGLTGPCRVRDLWAHKDIGPVTDAINATVNAHGAVLYRVSPVK